jgi:hypothetical protein
MKSVERIGRSVIERTVKDKQVVVKSKTDDDHVWDACKEVRNSDLIPSGRRQAPVHPQTAKIAYWFSAEEIPWKTAMRKHPDLFRDLYGSDQFRRELAAQKIAELYPEFVMTAPKARRLRSEPKIAQGLQ